MRSSPGGGRGRGGSGEGGGGKCYLCGSSQHVASNCPTTAAQSSEAPLEVTELPGGGAVVDVHGDLMSSPDSLCHCVSACLSMGKGIAVLFRQRFGRVDELRAQGCGVGGVAVLPVPEERRMIYYLITKPRYNDKPTYETLASSLDGMFSHMAAHGVTRISMPELGCGLDGLDWRTVRGMLCEFASKCPGLRITVYHFKPAKQMFARRGRYV